ncbi:DUF389 domain-containing protein [Neisseria musculi]|uniref:TIGR00341 family protein n=1 Tax=Neisseria musculi TaxID=1815583 RepID=A0A7H1M8Y7_9NEIS|nr:DUF389 domain-containing protein [Neisseria musculi]QNT58102.1 hypothetical protein H7A79_1459 [Neisseria musculi]
MARLQDVFSLRHDQAHPDKIDAAIRANVRVSGTNMWVLIFAIAVASIGLNVNSTAVIIGAMLISPLMGPIVGMGYGAAVGDMGLIRQALRNIAIFVAISLFTATVYFSVTPLQEAQSELLARTQPNLWDVLIAFFGGSAGIVAITRKEGGNAIPGVAIATALMPPLCTAGFGLAHGNWHYFFGAFYLFCINCVFIAFSTLLFAKLLKLPRRGLVTDSRRKLHRIVIAVVVLAVMVPSGYLAAGLVKQELFNTKASAAVKAVQQQEGFYILRSLFNHKEKLVGLIINGTGNSDRVTQLLKQRLEAAGVSSPQIKVLYAGGNTDLNEMKQELEKSQNHIAELKGGADIDSVLAIKNHSEDEAVLKEIQAQYPEADTIIIGRGMVWERAGQAKEAADGETAEKNDGAAIENNRQVVMVSMETAEMPSEKEKQRLQAWLVQRYNGMQVRLQWKERLR